jgi:23S rRNA (pseudouridine1915-N3)-methyltransferase
MRLAIVAVGRLKSGAERELIGRYAERIEALGKGHALGPLTITAIPESRAASAERRKAEEGRALVKALPATSRRIVLDERGRPQTSQAFAGLIRRERDDGAPALAFLIGGPDGHGEAIRADAALLLSLSAMTLPHGLARVVLAEQIYRALTVIAGHPYHRV